MTSGAPAVCTAPNCGRPRLPGAIFCECGALLDYTAPVSGNGHANGNGHTNGERQASDAAAQPTKSEWPPEAPYETRDDWPQVTTPPLRVIYCPWDGCGVVNPERLVICWNCKKPLRKGKELRQPWSWRRALRLERPPLRSGQRKRPSLPFFSTNPRALLRSSAIVLGIALAAAVLVIAAIKGWQYGSKHGPHWFSAGRERLFPRYRPHHPSSVFPTRYRVPRPGESLKGHKTVRVRRKIGGRTITRREIVVLHPAADAFDRNLSTYWQSRTARSVPDVIRINFKPVVAEFNDVSVYGGDPTAKTIVPRQLQMAFYTWEPHRPTSSCTLPLDLNNDLKNLHRGKGTWCVTEIKPITLLNTPAEQRFSFPAQRNVGQITITVTGTHHSDNPKARAAITDIEFFDRF